jgi:hypothetical protein
VSCVGRMFRRQPQLLLPLDCSVSRPCVASTRPLPETLFQRGQRDSESEEVTPLIGWAAVLAGWYCGTVSWPENNRKIRNDARFLLSAAVQKCIISLVLAEWHADLTLSLQLLCCYERRLQGHLPMSLCQVCEFI